MNLLGKTVRIPGKRDHIVTSQSDTALCGCAEATVQEAIIADFAAGDWHRVDHLRDSLSLCGHDPKESEAAR